MSKLMQALIHHPNVSEQVVSQASRDAVPFRILTALFHDATPEQFHSSLQGETPEATLGAAVNHYMMVWRSMSGFAPVADGYVMALPADQQEEYKAHVSAIRKFLRFGPSICKTTGKYELFPRVSAEWESNNYPHETITADPERVLAPRRDRTYKSVVMCLDCQDRLHKQWVANGEYEKLPALPRFRPSRDVITRRCTVCESAKRKGFALHDH